MINSGRGAELKLVNLFFIVISFVLFLKHLTVEMGIFEQLESFISYKNQDIQIPYLKYLPYPDEHSNDNSGCSKHIENPCCFEEHIHEKWFLMF